MAQSPRKPRKYVTVRVEVERARYLRFRRWARANDLLPASHYLGFLLDAARAMDSNDYRGFERPGDRPEED